MCLTPSVGVVNNSTQFFPVGLTRHGAVSTKYEVGRCILQHLIDSGLGLFNSTYSNDTQTLQSTKDGTAKTFLGLLQVKGRAVREVEGYVDDAGGIIDEGIEGLSILERCTVVADVEDIDLANLVGQHRSRRHRAYGQHAGSSRWRAKGS